MISHLTAQISVDEFACDQNRRIANAGFFSGRNINLFHLEAAAFCPARVHTQQHLRPVGGIGATFARLDSEIRRATIGGIRHRRLKFDPINFSGQSLNGGSEFCCGFAGFVFLGKFHQYLHVVTAADKLLKRADGCLEFPEFVRLLPRTFWIVPEVVPGHFVVDFCNAG